MSTEAYQPLDLTAQRNAGFELVPDEHPSTGQQALRGLPFDLGSADRAFIALGGDIGSSISVPMNATAHTVIVAHRLLDSTISQGGPLGVAVADYVFRLGDGTEHRTTIRERFEIAALSSWGMLPFASVPDTYDALLPRWSGAWGEAGRRQCEVYRPGPRMYFLWTWSNPRPDVPISALDIVAHGPRFVIGGITLGVSDEYPFAREGAVPVRIDIADASIAGSALDQANVQLTTDRGVASYTYALPSASDQAFAGWGEARNTTSTPLYAHVAATPSATLAVTAGDMTLGTVRWAELQHRRAIESERVRLEILEDGRNWVETTVVDDETGEPVPCRIHFRGPGGVPYQPHGHHNHVNSDQGTWHVDVGGDVRLGQRSYACIDGHCQGWLPRGAIEVDVARGYEYEPLRHRVTIDPGQRRLELRLRRMTNMNRQRWFSGDTHVHFLSTQGSLREAQSEDLNVVNLLQSQWGSLFTNTEDFTGEPVVSRDGRTIVWANQENRQHLLGHLILLGLKQPVYPWCSDGPDEAELGGSLETTLSHWADACHAQGGTVIIPHFPRPNAEPATLVATGRADALEMINYDEFNHLEYYRYLNAGYRLPLVGGTDKMSSDVAVGQYRTYVYVPPDEDFTYASWTGNLRLGRTFMSGGPLLEFSVDGALIGDTLRLPPGGGTVEVTARVRSILPVHTLQVVQGGRGGAGAEVATEPGGAARAHLVTHADPSVRLAAVGARVVAESNAADRDGAHELSLTVRVPVRGNSWLCLRAGGPGYANEHLHHHDVWQRSVFAHTSPIYVTCGDGDWHLADPAGLQYLLTLVDGSLRYVRDHSVQRPPQSVTHHHGLADHGAYLERPFLEAQAALQARLAGRVP